MLYALGGRSVAGAAKESVPLDDGNVEGNDEEDEEPASVSTIFARGHDIITPRGLYVSSRDENNLSHFTFSPFQNFLLFYLTSVLLKNQ